MPKFRLNEFRDVARWLVVHLPAPLSFFLNGWLYGLETSYIDAKASSAVEKGIAPLKPPNPVVEPPRYLSEPSEVEGLDIIQLSSNYDE